MDFEVDCESDAEADFEPGVEADVETDAEPGVEENLELGSAGVSAMKANRAR